MPDTKDNKNKHKIPAVIMRRKVERNKDLKLKQPECTNREEIVLTPRLRPKKGLKKKDRVLKEYPTNPYALKERQKIFNIPTIKRPEYPDPFMDDKPIRTVCDYFESFYTVVDGRPLNTLQDIKVYMTQIRKIFEMRTREGFTRDQFKYFEYKSKLGEWAALAATEEMMNQMQAAFTRFLQEDFNRSNYIITRSNLLKKELEKVSEVHAEVSFEYGTLKNEVLRVCDRQETLSLYAKFLDSISPPFWRDENVLTHAEEGSVFKNLFLDENSSHTDIIKAIASTSVTKKENYSTPLFFTTPEQFMSLIGDISDECFRMIELHGTLCDSVLYPVLHQKKALARHTKQDTEKLDFTVNYLQKQLDYWIERDKDLETHFFKICDKQMHRLFGSLWIAKLLAYTQHVCCVVFPDYRIDVNDSIHDLVANIESYFYKYRLLLDSLDVDIVKKVTKDLIAKDNKIMLAGKNAQRLLKEWNIMCKSLQESFKPPRKFAHRPVRVKKPSSMDMGNLRLFKSSTSLF